MAARNRYLTEEETLKILSAFSPMSAREFAEEAGISDETATQRLRGYIGRLVHIARFERHNRLATQYAIYDIGRHPNAKRLPKLTEAERTKRYREYVKADKKRYRERLKKQRKYYHDRKREDPMYAVRLRKQRAEWKRVKFGYRPRKVNLPNVAAIDPVLAALMGRK